MGRLASWLRLARAGNCLIIIALASASGYMICGGRDPATLFLVAAAPALVAAGGNAINDYFDREIDAVNKPWRPIPSGAISPRAALFFTMATYAVGIVIGFTLSPILGVAAAVAAAVLYAYSAWIKKGGLSGNLVIAALSAASVAYGSLAAPDPGRGIIPAIYAFLLILGREILKGVEDVVGDARHGVATIAVKRGVETALKTAAALLLGVVAISPLPLLIGYGALYGLLAAVGVDVPVVATLLYVRKDPVQRAWRATRVLKIPLFTGLLAFLLGAPEVALLGP